METITDPSPASVVRDYPVPGGFETWFAEFQRERADRRSRKRKEDARDRTRRKYAHVGPSQRCWACRSRLIAQGVSVNQRYARKHKVCVKCYVRGMRKETAPR